MLHQVFSRLAALTLMVACLALEAVGIRDEPELREANIETSWWRYH